jgi:hypothetical protein
MIFVPLPRFVFRPSAPFFSGRKTRVDKCLTDIDGASDTEFVRKGNHDLPHHAEPNPLLKSPVTGLERGVSVGEVGPRCISSQHPQDTVQAGPAAFPRVALGHHVVS